VFEKTVSATVIISLLIPQLANAAINQRQLSGGALGIIACQHIRGEKTKVTWRVIVSDPQKPINGTKFRLQTNGEIRTIFEGVIPPTTDYQITEIFDSLKEQVSIFGEAYSVGLSGIYRYYLRQPLPVQCD
jgi:hypothetical protein